MPTPRMTRFIFFFCLPSYICGVHHLVSLCVFDCFLNPTIEVVTFRLCGWSMVCFCCRHSPVEDMNVRFFGVRAMGMHVCIDCNSHPKEFWRNGERNHLNSKGKIQSKGGSEEVRTRDAVSYRTASPTHYRLSYTAPPPPPHHPLPTRFINQHDSRN